MTASARARLRLREEMLARDVSQRDLADAMTKRSDELWSQSRVGKVLTGKVETRLDDIALMAECLGLTVSEVVRDRGLEFYAEMAPSEVRIIEGLRRLPQFVSPLLQLLTMHGSKVPKPPVAGRRGPGRPKLSESDNRR